MNSTQQQKRLRAKNRRAERSELREMCFVCMRPRSLCHCAAIPTVENQTEILIAQHVSERSHPFNTARMVHKSLKCSKLISDYSKNMERYSSAIQANAGLLYPSPSAIDIKNVPLNQRPDQLIILDGTWSQVKRLYRRWPILADLPHYKINPETPGQYKIRLEPNEYSLSTVEATVYALQLLEPETKNLSELLAAFQTMVQRQLAHPSARYSCENTARIPTLNIPRALTAQYENLVVVYGEAATVANGLSIHDRQTPVYWVAKRLLSGERLCTAIKSENEIGPELLDYFGLTLQDFSNRVSAREFTERWKKFVRPNDILIVYNASTLRLLHSLDVKTPFSIALKSVNFDPEKECKTLAEFFEINDLVMQPGEFPGRSGRRLANLITLIMFLRSKKDQNATTTEAGR